MEPSIIGNIRPWHDATIIPTGWLLCDGRLLPAADPYLPLFQVLGNRYGGDGVTNFALPNVAPLTSTSVSSKVPITHQLPAIICYLGEPPYL